MLCSSETSTPSLLLLCLHRLHDGPSTQPARASSSPSVTPSAVPMRSQSSGYRAVSCCVPRRPQVRESAYAMVALPERHSQRCATALIARGRSGTGVARGAVLKYGRLAGRLRGHRGGRDRALAWPSAIAIHRDPSRSQLCGHPGAATEPSWPLRGHGDRDGDCVGTDCQANGGQRSKRTVGQPRSYEDAAVVVPARPSRSQQCGHPDEENGPSWPLRGHSDRNRTAVVARPLRRLGRLASERPSERLRGERTVG